MTTLENPNYLFDFYSQERDKHFLIYLDILNDSSRIDLFNITFPEDLDLPSGEFLYTVYESSDLNLSIEDKNQLETGRFLMVKEFPEGNFYTFNTENQVNEI